MSDLKWKFDTMEQAFDYVRECDKPQMVIVGEKAYKLYPSGKAEEITKKKASK